MLDTVKTEKDLNRPDVIDDFSWLRVHPTAAKKMVDRSSRGCELGSEDVKAFAGKASELLGRKYTGIICGHQHPDFKGRGARELKNPGFPGVIINSSVFSENEFRPGWIVPCIAKYRGDGLPEICEVPISGDDAEKCYHGQADADQAV